MIFAVPILLSTSSITPRAQRWVTDSIDWLKEVFGALTAKGFTEPNPALILNADAAPRLSISCTLDHIRTQSPAVQDIIKPLYDRMKAIADARQYSMEGLLRVTGGNTIRELMEMAGSPAEEIRTAAAALRQIENRIE